MGLSKPFLPAVLAAAAALAAQPGLAQQTGYGQTIGTGQQEREINFGSGPNRSSGVLDSANPIELMNKLRRGTAMDDATAPVDAIDAALRDYQRQSAGSTAAMPAPPSALVKPAQ